MIGWLNAVFNPVPRGPVLASDGLSTSNLHTHECRHCGTIWRHDPRTIPDEKNDEAHTCPRPDCGGQEFSWANDDADDAGVKLAQFCHNGVRTIAIEP